MKKQIRIIRTKFWLSYGQARTNFTSMILVSAAVVWSTVLYLLFLLTVYILAEIIRIRTSNSASKTISIRRQIILFGILFTVILLSYFLIIKAAFLISEIGNFLWEQTPCHQDTSL